MNVAAKVINRLGLVLIIGSLGLAMSQELHDAIDVGKKDYVQFCAQCHGDNGKGNGTKAIELASVPSDLTLLSKENGGSFPETLVYNIIDGRRVTDDHGQEMPIWGNHLKELEGNEEAVEERISNLIEYLKSIQAE